MEKKAAFLKVKEADDHKVLAVNLKGAFFTTQAFAMHRAKAKRSGKVVNISSVHAELAVPGVRLLLREQRRAENLWFTAGVVRASVWPNR